MANQGEVNIQGLDKVALLRALWARQKPAAFFIHGFGESPPFDAVAAAAATAGYIDYFAGRAIKTDLSTDTALPRLYDRDAGDGAMAEVVAELRRGAR